ncbi:MAG: sulfate permease [Sulfuricurvum sp. PC08-66]|nr:MAG: sulfate permease [Sulfuricurvum sp. PC08-66]
MQRLTKNLAGDMYGGITAAIVALPLALAFGVQSGMGAIAGLYGAIALGFFAALFGGTNTQISGPTGPMAVVAAVVVAGQVAYLGSLEAAFGTIIATFVLAGIFQIILGISGVGQYIRYMPYPVISGFMSGIGLIIILMQIFPFFGLSSPKSIIDIVSSLGHIPSTFNAQAILLASATIAIIYLFPRVTRKIPSALVALVILTLIATVAQMQIPLIGDIPQGLPEIHLDTILGVDLYHPMIVLIPAITLASLGAIDSLLTSIVADNMTKTQHNSKKELIGQGIGNTVAGLIGGLPGAGATMRTVVNINAGGRTKLSGAIHGIVLLIVLLGAGEYAKLIPLPVLAGILITVGIGIIDYKGMRHLRNIPRIDAFIMVVVLLLTVFVDLLQAVAVGLVMSSLWFMKQMGDTIKAQSTGHSAGHTRHYHLTPEEKVLVEKLDDTVYIQRFEGPIFFGFTAQFKEIMRSLPEVKTVIFRMKFVPHIDQSGLYAIEDAVMELRKKKIGVYFSGLQKQPLDMMRNIRFIPDLIGEKYIYDDFHDLLTNLVKEHTASNPT